MSIRPVSSMELLRPATAGADASRPPAGAGAGFAQAMGQARQEMVTVRQGDTLTGLVRARLQESQPGVTASPGQLHRMALALARDNGIANADLIHPEQRVDLSGLGSMPSARVAGSAPMPAAATAAAVLGGLARADASAAADASHPVLERTLQRALERHFLPESDLAAVRSRILELAAKHGFAPDDFARTVLMESDGLNPKASNGRCHGIIQFCSGAARGAASVGFAAHPAAIQALSVLQQLDLVDRYFDDTHLREYRSGADPVSLEDLYLTVLMPSARAERRSDAALAIAGRQASALHVSGNRAEPITRDSLASGLHAHALNRLSPLLPKPAPLADAAHTTDAWPETLQWAGR